MIVQRYGAARSARGRRPRPFLTPGVSRREHNVQVQVWGDRATDLLSSLLGPCSGAAKLLTSSQFFQAHPARLGPWIHSSVTIHDMNHGQRQAPGSHASDRDRGQSACRSSPSHERHESSWLSQYGRCARHIRILPLNQCNYQRVIELARKRYRRRLTAASV